MEEIEKVRRLNKIEAAFINVINNGYDKSDKSVSDCYSDCYIPTETETRILRAIIFLTDRPGEKIDEVLLKALGSKNDSISQTASKALESRMSYLDSQ